MYNPKTTVKCNKNLFHGDRTESFTKGEEYTGQTSNVLDNMKVINNQGEKHQLGNWSKHFKIISKKY